MSGKQAPCSAFTIQTMLALSPGRRLTRPVRTPPPTEADGDGNVDHGPFPGEAVHAQLDRSLDGVVSSHARAFAAASLARGPRVRTSARRRSTHAVANGHDGMPFHQHQTPLVADGKKIIIIQH